MSGTEVMAAKKPFKPRVGVMTEEESIRAAKDWIAQYGRNIILGIVLGLAGVGGWKGWNTYQDNHFQQAAELYIAYIEDHQTHAENLSVLQTDYAKTPYPALAYLRKAKHQVENNELEEAKASLQWVSDNAAEKNLAELARIRYSRILLDQKKYEEVIDYSEAAEYGQSTEVMVEEIRGDALRNMGNRESAAESYRKVLAHPLSSATRSLLLNKLSQVSN